MARGINKVILIGHLGADPDTRYMSNGTVISNIRVATTEAWRDRDSGEQQERTEWHSVVFFGRLAEIVAEYLRKGSQVYIEGRLRTRKWQDREGRDRWTTEIVAKELQMLGGRRSEDGQGSRSAQPSAHPASAQGPSAADQAPTYSSQGDFPTGDFDDDIPF